jgi:hypothetical protein
MTTERNSQIIAKMVAKIGLPPRVQANKDRGLCISFRSGSTYRERMRLCKNKASCGDFCQHHSQESK